MKDHGGILVRTCKKCKKPINEKALYDYCPDCYRIVDQVFDRIREYLKEYPGATAFEIEQETGIPYHVVINFVQEGRLVEIENDFIHIECKRCGCLLLSAHQIYCPACREQLQKELGEMKEAFKPKDNTKPKMHLQIHKK